MRLVLTAPVFNTQLLKSGVITNYGSQEGLSWRNGKQSCGQNHENKGASKGKDCKQPPRAIRTKAFMFLPESDVFAQCPPPPRELLVLRELCVGFRKHFPKRHVGAKSRQHKSAQENRQEPLWHAIILRNAIRSTKLKCTPMTDDNSDYTHNPSC